MISGARLGKLSGLRRLVATAISRDLTTFVIPGPDIARAHGLDLAAAGLQIVASPRHASVLLVVGDIPLALHDAATVIYAQMVRPRALFILGTEIFSSLPDADIMSRLSQDGLIDGVQQLRTAFAEGAFRLDVADFDAPALQIRVEYTCSMHPEIAQDEPGSCPKCGMTLIIRETQASTGHTNTKQKNVAVSVDEQMAAGHEHKVHHPMPGAAKVEYTCPMHPEVVQDKPGSCPRCGMNLEPQETKPEHTHDHQPMNHDAAVQYTCPMHPQVIQDKPGSCPECGMNLEPRDTKPEHTHDHQPMNHDAARQYTCPMHPEVIQDAPGACPKCGMNLELQETKPAHPHDHQPRMNHDAAVQYTCPMHPEVIQDAPGACPKCGMNLEPQETKTAHTHDHQQMNHEATMQYTCPMHPEVVQDEPGSCPECGMNLELRKITESETNEHSGMDHGDMAFMSMIDVTKNLPRSTDGLPMEWTEAPFGPFFPGLPGGLMLTLTLDGDTVADSKTQPLFENKVLLPQVSPDIVNFIQQITRFGPLSPVAFQLLACQALENAAGLEISANVASARIGALEQERIANHLGWLTLFAQQTGFNWLQRRAASLQLKFCLADMQQIATLAADIQSLIKRLGKTPLLKSRTVGIGKLASDSNLRGPVARASGVANDVRSTDKNYIALGFEAVSQTQGDAYARLQVRLAEIIHSLKLIQVSGAIERPTPVDTGKISATGEASVETPRGMAHLELTLQKGQVIAARLETPSTYHLDLIKPLTEQQALADALVAIGSLDLSPWEVQSREIQT